MANVVYFGKAGGTVGSAGTASASTQATFGSDGLAELDPTDTDLVAAVKEQGGVLVDQEGTEEVLTPGTVQTATTLSALFLRNGVAQTVLNVRALNATGTLLVGPITIAANAERVIVFPEALTATGGVFIDVDSGALNASPGSLIP